MDPTIALARAAALAPIKSAEWSVEQRDDAPDEMVDLVNRSVVPLLYGAVSDMLYAVDYGWQPFEKIWGFKNGRSVIEKLKPLLPDHSQVLVEEATGAYAGVKNFDIRLDPRYSLVFTNEMESGDFYGRSRYENIRQYAWNPWVEVNEQAGKYAKKAAGIIPMVRYPIGESTGKDGQIRSNADIAAELLRTLGTGHGVAMPQQIANWASSLIESGVNPDSIMSWRIEFIEAAGNHSSGMVEMMRYYDSLKMRGWLVPERTALEGQRGTLAESASHADLAITIAEQTLAEIARHLNWYVVDEVLAVNFGEEARGKVELVPAPLVDSERIFYRDLVKTIITQPMAYETAQLVLDLDAALDISGLPKVQEVVDPSLMVPDIQVTTNPTQPAPDTTVADTSLTGIQITSLRELVNAVSTKQLPVDAAKAIARVSFPASDPALIDKAIDLAARFTPAPLAASRSGFKRVRRAVMGRSGAEIFRRVADNQKKMAVMMGNKIEV